MHPGADADVVAAIHAWMERINRKFDCPLCGGSEWKIGLICEMPVQLATERTFQVIPLVCPRCAYTAFLAARQVFGVVPSAP